MPLKPTTLLFIILAASIPRSAPADASAELIQYGNIHEAIGQRKSQSRVALDEIVALPDFYGIGALEGLKAEITIVNSEVFVTGVTAEGVPAVQHGLGLGATMLAGMTVSQWIELPVRQDVAPNSFDAFIRDQASALRVDSAKPFLFMVDGEFADLRLHILNGACPMQARMKKLELAKFEQPYELEAAGMQGVLVGIYAEDSVGKLTHPDTNTHVHIIYVDPATGERITAHVERIGLAEGATLRLPLDRGPGSRAEIE